MNRTPASEVGGESVTTLPPWPLMPQVNFSLYLFSGQRFYRLKKGTYIIPALLAQYYVLLPVSAMILQFPGEDSLLLRSSSYLLLKPKSALTHFGHTLFLILPRFAMIYLMRSVLPQLSSFSEKKVKIIYILKGFPNLAYTLSGASVILDLATVKE